jgi:hypothetical protein
VEVGAPDDHGARGLEASDAGRGRLGDLGIERGAGRGGTTGVIDEVLQPDRHTGEEADLVPGGETLVDRGGPLQSPIVVERDERVDSALCCMGRVECPLYPLDRGLTRHEGHAS